MRRLCALGNWRNAQAGQQTRLGSGGEAGGSFARNAMRETMRNNGEITDGEEVGIETGQSL